MPTDDGEDDDGREHGREKVGHGHENGVPVAVVADGIVGREGDQSAKGQAKREENLRASFQPNDRVCQFLPLTFRNWQNKKSHQNFHFQFIFFL